MADNDDGTIETGLAPIDVAKSMIARTYHGLRAQPEAYGLQDARNRATMVDQGDRLHDLMTQLNQGKILANDQALISASGDPVVQATFFETIQRGKMSDGGLKWASKWRAAGAPQDGNAHDQYLRDDVRIGLWGARAQKTSKDQSVGDLFAAMEARDQAIENALPAYWSKNDQDLARDGLNRYIDRQMLAASKDGNPAKAREVSFVKTASVFNSLSNDAESLYTFARFEVARSTTSEKDLEALGDQQNLAVTNAQNVQKYPAVRARMQNLGVAATSGAAFAMAGSQLWSQYGGHLTEAVERFAKAPHLDMLHGAASLAQTVLDMGKEHLGAGLTIAGVTFMATQASRLGKFIGAPTTTLARLDEFVHKNPGKFAGMSTREAGWQQADFFMMTAYTNLSEHQLSDAQAQRFVEGMGYARAVVRADALGDTPPAPPAGWPQELKDRFASWTSHEFLGLATFREPTLANAYLFHTNSVEDRLLTQDTQRRLSFLGALPAPVRFDDPLIAQAREVATRAPWSNSAMLVSGTRFEDNVRNQFATMGQDTQRLLSFMPAKDRMDAVAKLGNHPLSANPAMDMVRQLNDSVVEQCEKVETPGFVGKMAEKLFVKKILGLDDGHLKGLGQTVNALWNARTSLKGLKPRQTFDFGHYDAELLKNSGSAGAPELLNRMDSWAKQRATAQTQYAADHPVAVHPRLASTPPANLPSLGNLNSKLSLRDQMLGKTTQAIADKLADDKTFQKAARRNTWTR